MVQIEGSGFYLDVLFRSERESGMKKLKFRSRSIAKRVNIMAEMAALLPSTTPDTPRITETANRSFAGMKGSLFEMVTMASIVPQTSNGIYGITTHHCRICMPKLSVKRAKWTRYRLITDLPGIQA